MEASFGVVLPQGFKGEFDGLSGAACAERFMDAAEQIESMGFDSAWLYDHLLPVPPGPAPNMEAWTSLASLASATKQIRLGTMVTSMTFRNPAYLAKMAGTVDALSRGRLE